MTARSLLCRRVLCLPVLLLVAALAGAREPYGFRAGVFDDYLLALSWSPTYCLTHADDAGQCGASKGYGFVLHGLWPQNRSGPYPQDCATRESLTPEAKAFGATIFPSRSLIAHEWQKHGSCSGLDALGYFRLADQARTAIRVPDVFESPLRAQTTTAAGIVAAFVSANPGLPAAAVVPVCRGMVFAELRICLDRQLSPLACAGNVRSNCGSRPVRVPAAR